MLLVLRDLICCVSGVSGVSPFLNWRSYKIPRTVPLVDKLCKVSGENNTIMKLAVLPDPVWYSFLLYNRTPHIYQP